MEEWSLVKKRWTRHLVKWLNHSILIKTKVPPLAGSWNKREKESGADAFVAST